MDNLKQKETVGIIFALAGAALWGIFPVLVNHGTRSIPPVTFAAPTTLLAAISSFLYTLLKGKLHEPKNQKAIDESSPYQIWFYKIT